MFHPRIFGAFVEVTQPGESIPGDAVDGGMPRHYSINRVFHAVRDSKITTDESQS